ncbi:MAG TPA: TIM barrel protein [Candidatus Thermoplasmatota archaeon]|nr:TIM barrel protein [Candidatus Thermoplasmatota archaeon]
MIHIGPAGVPLSCKGRTPLEGVQHCQELGLNAMEVQFVRGIRMDEEYAREVGRLARELSIQLSVHAPYYTNLASDDDKTIQKSIDKITLTAKLADAMGATVVVCHPGFYTSLTRKETLRKAIATLTTIQDYLRDGKLGCKLGLEVMGKQQTFGDLEEVVQMCQAVPACVPVIDFAHIHARSNGGLKSTKDFEDVFKRVDAGLSPETYYCYFTGVKYANNSEINHVPIKKGDMDFDHLVEVILDRDLDITLVSNSPIVEHDAMFMKIHIERMLEKRGALGEGGRKAVFGED